MVYGLGPSPIHPFPLTLPELLQPIRSLLAGFSISSGKNIQTYIHVLNLARIYFLLLSHALRKLEAGVEDDSGVEVWDPEAYYFAEQEELSFAEFMKLLLAVLQKLGLSTSSEIKEMNVNGAAEVMGAAKGLSMSDSWTLNMATMCGVDMRVRSTRARTLGWKPQEFSVAQTLHEAVGRYLEAEKSG